MACPFCALGVPHDADEEFLHRFLRRASLFAHPDKGANNQQPQQLKGVRCSAA